MMKTITDFCEKYNMLPAGETVLAAVSGGKDSVFLLHILKALSEKLGFSLVCAHFDHSLRGAESDRDARFVLELCESLGLPCRVGKGDVFSYARENGLGIEEAARLLRYDFLEKTADELGAGRIATAHTADDNAETLLLNLARGTGLRGLCGIPPVRGRVVRPLLETFTSEILDYLRENNIRFVEDSTNASDDYARNVLRHNAVPELRRLNSRFDENVRGCVARLREDEDFLSGLARDFTAQNYRDSALPARELAALPKPVAARVLLQITNGALSAGHIEAALFLAAGDKPHASLNAPGLSIRREYERLVFGGGEAKSLPERRLYIGENLNLPECGLALSSKYIQKREEINNSDNTFFFQHDSICGNMFVGARREGEKIRLEGRNGTKTLKKLFSEARLNGAGVSLVPVIYDAKGPIAVFGLGVAQRCAAKSGEKLVMIKIEKV